MTLQRSSRSPRHPGPGIALVLALLAPLAPALAQLPWIRFDSVFPPGGTVGSSVTVTVQGQDLDEAAHLRFSHPGLSAEPKRSENGQPQPNTFVVHIATNVPPGLYDLRLQGRLGISNPRRFAVGLWPEELEKGSNHSPPEAHSLELRRVVNARTEEREIDCYQFQARAGQRLIFECVAEELDSRMNPVMRISDVAGRERASSRRGGLLDFKAPADGVYQLRVHDFLFRGGPDYAYRLVCHDGPHVDFVFPPAGVPGSRVILSLYGRNLPGGEAVAGVTRGGVALERISRELELPGESAFVPLTAGVEHAPLAQAVVRSVALPEAVLPGLTRPLRVCAATAPVSLEQEPNDDPSRAQTVSVPCEIAGQFYPRADADWFAFEASKGEVLWVEMFSDRLNLPTSPFLLVQRVEKDEAGQPKSSDLQEIYPTDASLGGREYRTSHRDVAWRFEVKETGHYRILARDLHAHADPNPAFVYRLSLRRESPDFQLLALPQQPLQNKNDGREVWPWQLSLRRGDTWPVRVLALRQDQFNGEIDLRAEGLPPGVRCTPVTIPPGENAGLLWLHADDTATNQPTAVRIIGTGKVGDKAFSRPALAGTVVWTVGDFNNQAVQSRLTQELTVAVNGSELTPIHIAAAEDKTFEAHVDAKLEIPLRISRSADFNETLKMKATGLQALEKLSELEIKAGQTNATLTVDLKEFKLPPGQYEIALRTLTKGKYRNQPEAAQQADADSKKAEQEAVELAAAAKKSVERLTAASQAAEQAEVKAKAAAEALATARAAAEKAAQDDKAQAARASAEKQSEAAAAAARTAAEAKAAAEKARSEAESKAKDAEARKKAAADRAKAAADRAKPQDVTFTVYSAPLRFKVLPAAKQEVAKNESGT